MGTEKNSLYRSKKKNNICFALYFVFGSVNKKSKIEKYFIRSTMLGFRYVEAGLVLPVG